MNRSDERVDTASLRENKNIGRTCVCLGGEIESD